MKSRDFVSIVTATLGLGVLFAGCGGTTPVPVTAAPGGVVATNPYGTGIYANGICYGVPISVSGQNVCKMTYSLSIPVGPGYPALRPTETSGPYAFPVYGNGITLPVKAGDRLKITVDTSNTGLGTRSGGTNSYLGGLITISTSSGSCNVGSAGATNGGLYGTDGTEIFFIGNSITKVMPRDGNLKVGFDDTWVTQNTQWCWKLAWSATLEHCENTSGVTVACP